MYGLTEAFRSTYLAPEEIHRSSPEQGNCIGKAIPNTEIIVITKEGKEASPGEPGELVHRGPTVAMGYWGNEEATERAYRPNPLAPPELLDVERVVYSSCNAESLARDLALMPSLRVVEARVLDMFPHTTHYEVMVLLSR